MSGETSERDDDRHLAAEYALGLLGPAEMRAFEARLAAEPALRDDYALWAEEFAVLVEAVPEVAPPRDLQGRIEAALFAEAPAGGVPGWRRWGIAAVLGAALAVLVLVVGPWQGGRFAGADLVAQLETGEGTFVVAAGYDRDSGLLELERRAGRPAEGRSYELWLIAGDAAPVSLGVMPEVPRAVVVVPEALRAAMEGGTLAVSDEPAGGSPTGAPTGPVVAAAPLVTAS